ncbi:MAG: hypothetical protein SO373_07145 [Candidatus Borkfalkiaceae bacterium]|nr:hypothetical protein [Christensenellaceae bacterium]
MNLLQVSDEKRNYKSIEYLQQKISNNAKCKYIIKNDGDRFIIYLSCEDEHLQLFKKELADYIAEIICIAYKYNLFNDSVSAQGLSVQERELLLSAIIAADFEDDKRFVKSRIQFDTKIAVDGLFNFRLQSILKKWEEISTYIPQHFTREELKEFIGYLINEKRGRKVYIKDDAVYDGQYRKMERSNLLPKGYENKLLKEVLLSGAGEIFISGSINKSEYGRLSDFFGDKIFISRG